MNHLRNLLNRFLFLKHKKETVFEKLTIKTMNSSVPDDSTVWLVWRFWRFLFFVRPLVRSGVHWRIVIGEANKEDREVWRLAVDWQRFLTRKQMEKLTLPVETRRFRKKCEKLAEDFRQTYLSHEYLFKKNETDLMPTIEIAVGRKNFSGIWLAHKFKDVSRSDIFLDVSFRSHYFNEAIAKAQHLAFDEFLEKCYPEQHEKSWKSDDPKEEFKAQYRHATIRLKA